jgi:hypothetical protein
LIAKDPKAALEVALDQLKLFGRISGGLLDRSGGKAFVEAADSL